MAFTTDHQNVSKSLPPHIRRAAMKAAEEAAAREAKLAVVDHDGEVHTTPALHGDSKPQAAMNTVPKLELMGATGNEKRDSSTSDGDTRLQGTNSVARIAKIVKASGGERLMNLRAGGDTPNPVTETCETDYEIVEQDHEVVDMDQGNVEKDFILVEKKSLPEEKLPEAEHASGEDWVQIHKSR